MGVENASSSPDFDASRRVRTALADCATAGSSGEAEDAFARLRVALLDYGLRTSENVAAVDRIDFGSGKPDAASMNPASGLRAKASGYLLTDVLWRLEDEPIPSSIREDLPDLTQGDWSALLRIATLVLTAFESRES